MLKTRVIPSLLIENGRLVKTVKFANPTYVGDPINAIKIFNEKEVDELILLDILASREKREPDFELIEQISSECFMPLCYGGGIKNKEQAKRLFEIGIEKVSIQTATFNKFSIIEDIASEFGSQSLVISVDIKKDWRGKHRLFTSSSGKKVKKDWKQYLRDLVSAGAGEILLNSVDQDGVMAGMDLDLINIASDLVNVPVVAAGGVGSLRDLSLAQRAGASAIAVGSYFVFHGPHRAVLITYPQYSELETLLIKKRRKR